MSYSATISGQFSVNGGQNTGQQYRFPGPGSFQVTLNSFNGPTPGTILVQPHGTDVNLSQLTALGGIIEIWNQDSTNWVEFGIWDSSTNIFYPLGSILPGEAYRFRTSPNLQQHEPGTSIPGTDSGVTTLRFKANLAPCRVYIGAWDP